MSVGILAGPAYDAGYFAELIWAGTVLVPGGFMLTSLCKEYWEVVLAQGESICFCGGWGSNADDCGGGDSGDSGYRDGLLVYPGCGGAAAVVHETEDFGERVGR